MELQDYLRFAFALAFVLSLMGLVGYVLRRVGPARITIPGSTKRLSILEIRPIDARHRLVLVKCDDTEHLLAISPENQIVIQSKEAAKP